MQFCDFFFFQAEDGIRDSSVTGVQTCALPIYSWRIRWRKCSEDFADCDAVGFGRACNIRMQNVRCWEKSGKHLLSWSFSRSEERRVGKECRSRWSPYH